MKILFTSFEVAPFMKAGGLADVAGSLPKFLEKLGHQIAIFCPFIRSIDEKKYDIVEIPNSKIKLKFDIGEYYFTLKMCKLPSTNINVFFIDNKKYFSSFDSVYPETIDARYEQERFVVFSKAILEYAKLINFKPDIVHANDWHTSMIPVYLKSVYKNDDFYKNSKVVFSIHNLAYQGRYYEDILDFARLPKNEVYHSKGVEHFEYVVWMKGAINYSDKVVTVSPTYAREILTQSYGEGLDWTLCENKEKLEGILNGVDYEIHNPKIDSTIISNYDDSNLDNKLNCKKDVLNEFGLKYMPERPLIGIVSRLVEQKGFDLFLPIAEKLKSLDADFVVLGSADRKYKKLFDELNKTSKNIRAILGYKETLGNKIYAGSDMFLMPSRFEPCGISQLIALKYGSVPIVRETGGLEDTIVGYPLDNSNGFKFWRYEPEDMLEAINTAINVYKDKSTWNAMIKSSMNYDYSWQKSAQKYSELYSLLQPLCC